jgi:fatty-acyl-CoA synthase
MQADDLHRPRYVPELLVAALQQTPERPLLELADGSSLSVGTVRDATSRYVQALQQHGVVRATRVGLLSGARIEVLYLVNAVQLTAAIYVPLHPLGSVDDHAHVLADAGVELLIFDAARHAERADALAQRLPSLRLLALGNSNFAVDLNRLADDTTPLPLVAPAVGPHDVLRLGYSGGTTGQPKRIASVQRVGLATVQAMMSQWEWPVVPRFLSCTPLSHAGAAMFLPLLLRGGTMHVLPAFEPVAVLQAIQTHRINCLMLVPTMIYALLDHPRFNEFDLSSLETVFYGASAIAPARLKEAIERIGPVFMQFYGQAEAPMSLAVLKKRDHDVNDPLRLASCGRPSPWVYIELQDGEGNPVPDGEPGEICVRGPLVMDGYGDSPELTAEAFRGGWLHTGDVAVRDARGFLRIVDRTKDMIVSGGFNIYPREIEDVIAEHPAVAQVAVVGLPHDKWGEAVTACVVLKPGAAVEADELIAAVASRKGAYQAPKRVEFVGEIPQTAVGKPDKKALKARFRAASAN